MAPNLRTEVPPGAPHIDRENSEAASGRSGQATALVTSQVTGNSQQIQMLVERMFHVDHALHSMQDHVLAMDTKLKGLNSNGQQLQLLDDLQRRVGRLDDLQRRVDTLESNQMKAPVPRLPPEKFERLEEKVNQLELRLDKLDKHPVSKGVGKGRSEDPPLLDQLQARLDTLEKQSVTNGVKEGNVERVASLDSLVMFEDLKRQQEQCMQECNDLRERVERAEESFTEKAIPAEEEAEAVDIRTLANFAANPSHHTCGYQLNESVWDAGFLLFTPALRTGASVSIAILFILNFLMQGTFLVICTFFFTQPSFNKLTVDAAMDFRLFDAHHDDWLMHGTSLAQRLCDPDHQPTDPIGLVIGGYQNDITADIQSYLKQGSDQDWIERAFNGQMMCVLALTCWVLSVISEFATCFDMIACSVKLKATNHHTLITTNGEDITIESVSGGRKISILVAIIIRFAIAVALTIYGCIWLGGTGGITDLLLNAVALGFILSIDEMLYAAMVPDRAKSVMARIKPLPREHWPSPGGFDLKNALLLLVLPIFVSISCVFVTNPMVKDMREVLLRMCEGDLNFTYAHSPTTSVLISPILASTGAKYSANLTRLAVMDKIKGVDYTPPDQGFVYPWSLYVDPSLWQSSVRVSASSTIAVAGDQFNPSCRDMFQPNEQTGEALQLRSVLLQQTNRWVSQCSDIHDYCGEQSLSGQVTRIICAETCRCHSPFAPIGTHAAEYGCPASCLNVQNYIQDVHQASCTDPSPTEMNRTQYWRPWAQYMTSLRVPGHVRGVGDAMLQYGCKFPDHIHIADFSADEITTLACRGYLPGRMRPLAVACPQTCHCQIASSVLTAGGRCEFGPHNCINLSRLHYLTSIR